MSIQLLVMVSALDTHAAVYLAAQRHYRIIDIDFARLTSKTIKNVQSMAVICQLQTPTQRRVLIQHTMEKKHKEKAEASFTLKEKYKKMQITHPTEVFTSKETVPSQNIEVDKHIEWYEVNSQGGISVFNEPELGTVGGGVDNKAVEVDPCLSKSNAGNRVFMAQFGRQRTHNEQTLVQPCRIIYVHATMFGAEAVSNFFVCLFLLLKSR